MASIADRNRDLMIARLESDTRLEGAKVRGAATLMRVSIFVLIGTGIAGAAIGQLLFGEGGIQFMLGLVVGYVAYFGYLYFTLGEPRILGVMAALTDKKLLLLGSRKRGIVGDYNIRDIESLEILRKGNLFLMGKIGLTPVGEERIVFLSTNRRMGLDFVAAYDKLTGK